MIEIDNYIIKISNSILEMGFEKQNLGVHGMGGNYFLFENNSLQDMFSVDKFCEKSFAWKHNSPFFSFCAGRAGINWIYTYLFKQDLLDVADYNFLCNDDDDLIKKAFDELAKSNFDFLHGGLGIAWYFLYKPNLMDYSFFFERVITNLERIVYQEMKVLDFQKKGHPENRVNISISHGLSSVLKYCLECYKSNLEPDRYKKICLDIAWFIIQNKNEDNLKSYLPYVVFDNDSDSSSRLAWCYGDLTTAYLLLQVGTTFNKLAIRKLAMEILIHASKRRSFEDTGVLDAGICHGSSGIAYLFHKLFDRTNKIEFKEARDYWIYKTYSFARPYKSDLVQFPQYNTNIRKEVENHSLLEGTCGVGVVLNSIKHNFYDWDYCLMLND